MTSESNRVERHAALKWVPIALMRVSNLSQREFKQYRVDHIATHFDLEQIGTPTVNRRGQNFYIIDGQHRIEALRAIGWGDQQIQCWTYTNLTEEQEAEKFLKLNDTLTVNAMDKFRIGVQAGRQVECDIDKIVQAQNLRVSSDKIEGGISAIGTLLRVYNREGGPVLARALRIIRDSYGTAGLRAEVIDGMGMLCGRYNGDLEDALAVIKLSKLLGGVNGLLGNAEVIRQNTGRPKGHCVAAAAVAVINSGRGGSKLASWWREAS